MNDEAQIRHIIGELFSAICARDVDRIIALYAPDVVAFDVKPPLQIRGAREWRDIWAACMPCLPTTFGIEHRDLAITVSGDLAMAHWLWRFTGLKLPGGAAAGWLRSTAVYRKIGGVWKIVHEHDSMAINPETGMVAAELEP